MSSKIIVQFSSQEISWVPVDVAASALLEMAGSPEPILHLVHPRPVNWSVFSDASSAALGIHSVPYEEWIGKVRKSSALAPLSATALVDNPVLHLLDIMSEMKGDNVPSVDRALTVSRTLREVKKLEEQDVILWISYWRSRGFIS